MHCQSGDMEMVIFRVPILMYPRRGGKDHSSRKGFLEGSFISDNEVANSDMMLTRFGLLNESGRGKYDSGLGESYLFTSLASISSLRGD